MVLTTTLDSLRRHFTLLIRQYFSGLVLQISNPFFGTSKIILSDRPQRRLELLMKPASQPHEGKSFRNSGRKAFWNLRFGVLTTSLLFAYLCGFSQDHLLLDAPVPEVLTEINIPDVPSDRTVQAIVGMRLIDGTEGDMIENAVVVIDGNRIASVGKQGEVEIPDDAEVHDASGLTMVPGLIDAHYHSVNNNPALETILKNGTTTIRDPGHPFRFYQALFFSQKPMPRVFVTGAHLDGFPGVYKQQAVLIRNAAHAQETVYEHVRNGGSGIKIYFRLPLKYFKPVTDAAKLAGVPVFAHLELVPADSAIMAGLDGIEHITSLGVALASPEEGARFQDAVFNNSNARREWRYRLWSGIDLNSERTQKLIELMVSNRTYLVPTLAAFEKQAGSEGVEEYEVTAFQNMMEFVRKAHQAGVEIVGSSHTWGEYADPGFTLQREMELLAEAGMTPLEVIRATTIKNAHYFRSASRIGSIEVGKLADFVLLNANPAENISNMKQVSRVMINGQWVE